MARKSEGAVDIVNQAIVLVRQMNQEQFNLFRENFRRINERHNLTAMASFSLGDIVKFRNSRTGDDEYIRLTRYGRKRVIGDTVYGPNAGDKLKFKPIPGTRGWRVTASLCTLVQKAGS